MSFFNTSNIGLFTSFDQIHIYFSGSGVLVVFIQLCWIIVSKTQPCSSLNSKMHLPTESTTAD